MDVDADHSGKERIVFFPMNHQTVESIVIKGSVVDLFGGRVLSIDLFIGIGAAGDIGIQADIPVWSCFDNPSIFGGRNRKMNILLYVVCRKSNAT